ncbi:hypothetical protein CBS9595_002727 [Malassezia furfur]|nr:hypothetical protein CBS9595_002727 [Malassezia furfur]
MSEASAAQTAQQPAEQAPGAGTDIKSGSPNDFLKGVTGKRVAVRLNSGIDYLGTLSCLDGYMNIAMEETTEHVDGQLKNHLGDAFIRGNNVLYITALEG